MSHRTTTEYRAWRVYNCRPTGWGAHILYLDDQYDQPGAQCVLMILDPQLAVRYWWRERYWESLWGRPTRAAGGNWVLGLVEP